MAILELGGGFAQADLDAYFRSLGIPSPEVTAAGVDGASNQSVRTPTGFQPARSGLSGDPAGREPDHRRGDLRSGLEQQARPRRHRWRGQRRLCAAELAVHIRCSRSRRPDRTGGVPDVAGNADPQTGYRVRVDGRDVVIGGASAVSPLWAALIARLAQATGRSFGLVQPVLDTTSGTQTTDFRDITVGNNGAYTAAPGWDACIGLGVPIGDNPLSAFGATRRGVDVRLRPTLAREPSRAADAPDRTGRHDKGLSAPEERPKPMTGRTTPGLNGVNRKNHRSLRAQPGNCPEPLHGRFRTQV
jgi:hypothetical protein